MIVLMNKENIEKYLDKKVRLDVIALTKESAKMVADLANIEVPMIEDILPATAVFTAMSEGKISKKKVIKEIMKNLDKKKIEKHKEPMLMCNIYMLINVVMENAKSSKITCFVLPDDKEQASFITDYLEALFGKFGYDVLSKGKKIKKAFKEITKAKKKKRKSVTAGLIDEYSISNKGIKLCNKIRKQYQIEIVAGTLVNYIKPNDFSISKKNKNALKDALVKNADKKAYKKLYKELYEMEVFDIPSLKKVKKIKNPLVPMVLAYINLRINNINPGTKEFNKEMSPLSTSLGLKSKEVNDTFMNKFK